MCSLILVFVILAALPHRPSASSLADIKWFGTGQGHQKPDAGLKLPSSSVPLGMEQVTR